MVIFLRSRREVCWVWAKDPRGNGFLALFCCGFVLAVGELWVFRGMENEVEKGVGGRQF